MVNSRAKRGNGFRGVLDYLADHDNGHAIGGNMCGATPRDLAREFGAGRRARPDVKKPVWHMALRLPAGEKLTEPQWAEIADAFVEDMEFTPSHQRTYFLHEHKEGQHIHIVCGRVGLDGSLWYGQDENLKATKICQNLETRFGLTLTQKPELDKKTNLPSARSTKKRKAPKKPEIEKSLRTLTKPPRAELADLVDKCLSTDKPKTPEALRTALAARGVETEFFIKDEKIAGVTFMRDGLKFSGSSLGDDYKFSRIMERMANDKTQNHTKPTNPKRDEPDHPGDPNLKQENPRIGKKGLRPRTGRRATEDENKTFQISITGDKNMENQKMIGGLAYRRRTPSPADPGNLDHGWVEFTDRGGEGVVLP